VACSTYPPEQPADGLHPGDLDQIEVTVRSFLANPTRHLPRYLTAEDLIQECALHWARRSSRYQADRGASRTTFLKRVVEHKLADLWRNLSAAKHIGENRAVPFSTPLDAEERVTVGDLLPDDAEEHEPEDRAEQGALVVAVRQALERLSARQREIVRRMLAGEEGGELAGALGIGRSTLYRELERFREALGDLGLKEWL